MQTPEPFWQSADNLSRLYLGNAFDVMSSIPDDSIDCVWTDPPYFLSNDGITCVAGRMVKVNKGEWDRSRGLESDHDFARQWLAECHRILKPAGTIWVTGTVHVYLSVGMAMLQLGYRILNDITWEKPNPPPNLGRRTFTHSAEKVLWGTTAKKRTRPKHTFNRDIYKIMRKENGGRQLHNLWTISPPGRKEKTHGKHPTQKPLALIQRCLMASTRPGELVFDPFTGSGSTGVAALGLGRRFWGAEYLQEFADLACARLTETDGNRNARHDVETGEST